MKKKLNQKVVDARKKLIPIISKILIETSEKILKDYPNWETTSSSKPGQIEVLDGSGELTAIVITHMGYAKETAREISLNLTKVKDILESLEYPESLIPKIYTDYFIKDKIAKVKKAKENWKKAEKLVEKRKKLYLEIEKLNKEIDSLI